MRRAEACHFHDTACQQRGLSIVAEPQPVTDSGCDRDHILQCPGQLDTDDIRSALETVRSRTASAPDLAERDWARVTDAYSDVYRQVGTRGDPVVRTVQRRA